MSTTQTTQIASKTRHKPLTIRASTMIPVASLINHQPSRPKHVNLHGRRHYVWNGQISLLPIDGNEAGRLEALHDLIYAKALGDRLHLTPLDTLSGEIQILDVAYSLGIWTQWMAMTYGSARVVGIDIEAVGDQWNRRDLFPNCEVMCPVDYNEPVWGSLQLGSFDFIHVDRTGKIELIMLDLMPRPIDGSSFPPEAEPMRWWYGDLMAATHKLGLPIAYREDTGELLQSAGYVDVKQTTIAIPMCDTRGFARDARLASALRAAMGDRNFHPHQSISMSAFTQAFADTPERYPPGRVWDVCDRVTDIVTYGVRTPIYFNL
ncbi:hypothetical protein LTR53_004743 [Teratosphaeriaceae sp. CCFEE 6253]|nr:hypothetical protein LTR53_004743 [Teratosphaeriaceae sp. CCFEE 6253]